MTGQPEKAAPVLVCGRDGRLTDKTGLVFDIEEFALFDGPGIRSVIFLKGCPLRCEWCHNPEGLLGAPQLNKTLSLCQGCGLCDQAFMDPGGDWDYEALARSCPAGALRVAGKPMKASEAARRVLRNRRLLEMNGGGVTFSGGEPLRQADFILSVLDRLDGLHACVETSGHAKEADFLRVTKRMDLVLMDVKAMDSVVHKRYTGVGNELILRNLDALMKQGTPFRLRVPLIPGVNDSEENLRALAKRLLSARSLEKVELMRYNQAAGAKYAGLGMHYEPSFDTDSAPAARAYIFKEAGIPCDTL